MKDTPTISELKHKLIEYVKEPRTKQEIYDYMDCDITEPMLRDLVGKGAIRIAPQSNGNKWVQTAKAIKMERGEERCCQSMRTRYGTRSRRSSTRPTLSGR